jgi:hypothetical protein
MELRSTELVPNYALRSAIQEWAAAQGITLSPPMGANDDPGGCLTLTLHRHEALWAIAEKRRQNISSENSSCHRS